MCNCVPNCFMRPHKERAKDPVVYPTCSFFDFSCRECRDLSLYRKKAAELIDDRLLQYETNQIADVANLIELITEDIFDLTEEGEHKGDRIWTYQTLTTDALFKLNEDLSSIAKIKKISELLKAVPLSQKMLGFNGFSSGPAKVFPEKKVAIGFNQNARLRVENYVDEGDSEQFMLECQNSVNMPIRKGGKKSFLAKFLAGGNKTVRSHLSSYNRTISPAGIIANRLKAYAMDKLKGKELKKEISFLLRDIPEKLLSLVRGKKTNLEICEELKDILAKDNKEEFDLGHEEFILSVGGYEGRRYYMLPDQALPLRLRKAPELEEARTAWTEGKWKKEERRQFTYDHLEEGDLRVLQDAIDALFEDKRILDVIQKERSETKKAKERSTTCVNTTTFKNATSPSSPKGVLKGAPKEYKWSLIEEGGTVN